ncbi:small heat shock protein, chloroplastic-like isoform X1 [Typha latifolia]|uniref:small heat shock protein, chloroplastic-like isoform X1 n=1 Tax=Typha latifolia TaxID=4733 RepID=UPI003C2DEE68
MAAMIISKRSSFSNLLNKLRLSSAISTPRFFATDAREERGLDVNRRGDTAPVSRRSRGGDLFPNFFSDPWDPFTPGRSLSQIFNVMDQMLDAPLGRGVLRRGWDVREDENALCFKVEMPGLGKEDVRIWVEETTLVIKGEKEEEDGDDGEGEEGEGRARRRYSSRIDLPGRGYKLDQIKAEMKNGMLKVVVPKAKEEERDDVVPVMIE